MSLSGICSGVTGDYSVILGGDLQSNSNNYSAIIGGSGITTISDHTVYVPNLNINYVPSLENSNENFLVRKTNGDIVIREFSSISNNFLSANTSYYTQDEINSGFVSANTFDSVINTNGINNTGNITATTYYGSGEYLSNINHNNLEGREDYNQHQLSAITWKNDTNSTLPDTENLQFLLSNYLSSGSFDGFDLTDNGDGTVDIGAGSAVMRTSNYETDELIATQFNGTTGITFVDNATNFFDQNIRSVLISAILVKSSDERY